MYIYNIYAHTANSHSNLYCIYDDNDDNNDDDNDDDNNDDDDNDDDFLT